LRTAVLDQGWHWVDVDPFGSPMPFLDTAIQSLARRAVLEISATDTAALTGSSRTALMRRYGARVKTDGLAHDSGMRVLLACIARNAASHDRSIQPILSIWDSHHLRVSVKVTKSIKVSNELEENLGWRVSSPKVEEVQASIDAKLMPPSSLESLPMHCFLPLSYPINRKDNRVSGPLWIGQIGEESIMAGFTEEIAMSLCTTSLDEGKLLSWTERDFELEKRRILRSIRYIQQEAEVADCRCLILTDDLASWQNQGSPPSPNKMIELIQNKGFKAARSHYSKPSFRTNAPWDIIVECLNETQPPM
jgi:tRNA (guanine26-N2/guanine27-N2)-dimethyltransferase